MLSAASATHEDGPAESYDPCACLGYDALPTYFFEEQGYGEMYGTSCSDWDSDQAYCMDGGEYEGADWCAPGFDWCYVDYECEDSSATEVFADTEWDGWLEWRNCDADEDWVDGSRDGANTLVAAAATAFAVASFAM